MNIAKSSTPSLQDTLTKHQDLHSQLMALSFDDSFLPRLLRETGWTTEQCDRTLQEYRRFLFLHRTANHTVIPSQMVDKVWHLHLLYTRSYWEDLCDNILKTALHHQPGSATGDQRHFFRGNYEATLQSYETTFHHAPPADIWPEPALQFAHPKPKTTHWHIPKPTFPKLTLPKLMFSKLPSWVYDLAIAFFACIIAIALHIDILANLTQLGFNSSLKYGLILVAIFYGIKFPLTTYNTIHAANHLIKIPLKIDPETRRESDPEKSAMQHLGSAQTYSSCHLFISCLAALTAAYIQACQMTHSLFLYASGTWWLWLFLLFVGLCGACAIATSLSEFIPNQILQKLTRQEKITLPNQSTPSNWKAEVYKHRPRLCQDCKTPVEYLKLNNLKQFLTEKEQFAQKLNSINITHSHDHCAKCSPAPARENLLFRITPQNDYSRCLKCTTVARKTTTTILQEATTSNTGKELISQDCAYCQDHSEQTRTIPQIEQTCNDYCY
jgi:hypothetical protein